MKVGIAGIGAVGSRVARALDRGEIAGCELAAISARNEARAAPFVAGLSRPVPNVPFAAIAGDCDIVVEALPPSLFEDIAIPVLTAGKTLVVLSASQLLDRSYLIDLARQHGGRILVPSGAMLGIDAIKAAAVGTIHDVTIVTRKPPKSLAKAPYVVSMGLDLDRLDKAVCILKGSVEEVARAFPANVNVAAAVSLAGLGPSRTTLEIWADPALDVNTHTVTVASDSSDFTMSIQNRPSDENPATGRITAQSVIALLRQLNATVRVGT